MTLPWTRCWFERPRLGIGHDCGGGGADRDERSPIDVRASVLVLAAQLGAVQTLIGSIEKRIKTQHRANDASRRLETIPGIGVIGRPRSPRP
jgi:hypothetical protein